MNLYDFLSLDNDLQAQAVWDGVFLESRAEGDFKYLLYDLGGFYAELTYDSVQNEIKRIRPFKKIDQVMPYLDALNLRDLT